jgi:NitT/TauT family transport system substrate-binding protein
MVAAFAGGSIEAAATGEPFTTQLAAKGLAAILKRFNEFSPNNQAAVLVYGPRFMQERPDAARRFMTGYLRSVRYYSDAFFKQPRDKAAYEEVVGILTKETTVKDPALYAQMQVPAIHPDGKVQVQSLKDDQEWYLENGYQKTKIDLDDAVDMSYAEYAVKQLGGPYKR